MLWEKPRAVRPRLQEIVQAMKQAQTLILATDPDREGEAISWHIQDELAVGLLTSQASAFFMCMPCMRSLLQEIAQAIKQAEMLILATFPDREGVAISWHIQEAVAVRTLSIKSCAHFAGWRSTWLVTQLSSWLRSC